MKTNLARSSDGYLWSRREFIMALDGRVKVAVIVGTAFQGVAQCPTAAGCHFVLYVDVAAEMEAAEPGEGVLCLRLAEGHTIGTLTELRCPAALKQLLADRPGVNLDDGLAQFRPIGKLAVQALLEDPTFKHFVRSQILERLMFLTNGSLVQISFFVYAGAAGGTGGPAANVLVAAFASEIEKRSRAIVDIQNVRVGSLSYVGLGDRVYDNVAATLTEDLYWARVLPRDKREVRRLYFTELPMVQADKKSRSAYATQFAQAFSCRGVQEVLKIPASNRATQTEWGTVTTLEVSYGNGLSPRRIAEDATQQYLTELEAIGTTPSRLARLQQIRPVLTWAKSTAKSVEALMTEVKDSKGVKPENLVDECLKATDDCTAGTVTVAFNRLETCDLDSDLLARSRRPAMTVAEWKEKYENIRTMQEGLAKAITEREPGIQKHERKLHAATQELRKAIELHYPEGMLKKTVAFLANPHKKLVALQNAITKCRELSLQKLRLTSERDLLANARARFQDVLDDENRRLEAVLNLLRPFQRPMGTNARRTTECVPLDAVLPELVTLAEQGKSGDNVLRTLASCVAHVTLAGLAEIVGATEPQVASVTQRLVSTPALVRGPYWGGRIPKSRGQVISVLPPVEESLLEDIRTHARLVDGNTLVVAADTAQGGANVVGLEVHSPREIQEIFTELHKASLDDLAVSREMYFNENDSSLNWIAGRLNGVPTAA